MAQAALRGRLSCGRRYGVWRALWRTNLGGAVGLRVVWAFLRERGRQGASVGVVYSEGMQARLTGAVDSIAAMLERIGDVDPASLSLSADEVDRRLTVLGTARSGMDYVMGRYMLVAERTKLYKLQGFGSLTEYLENRLGVEGRVRERLRVARRLEELPQLDRAFALGQVKWSSVREVSRVATAETEGTWLSAISGKSAREVQPMVAGKRMGALPSDAPDPTLLRKTLRFEVTSDVPTASKLGLGGFALYARFLEFREKVKAEVDDQLTDEQVLKELLIRGLGGAGGGAPFQVSLSTCPSCRATEQLSGKERVPVDAAVLETAECDCVHIGATDKPGVERARSAIPPATRRKVLARDGGCCRVPGCTNSRYVDIHHLMPQSIRVDHDESNLLVLCTLHHALFHEGFLIIRGERESEVEFFHVDGRPYGQAPTLPGVDEKSDAFLALRSLGYSRAESRARIEAAVAHVGHSASPTEVLQAALHAPPVERSEARADAELGLQSLGISKADAAHWVSRALDGIEEGGGAEALMQEALRLRHVSRSSGSVVCEAVPAPLDLGGGILFGEDVGLLAYRRAAA